MVTYGSLFSGVGGFELGLNKIGWECKWMCEIDPYASSVLEYHWPEIPIYPDVRELSFPEPVDVVVGGFPCQDLSMSGLKAGYSGDKSDLFYDFVRIVKEMRESTGGEYPKAVIWENVQGILNKQRDWISRVYSAWGEVGALVQEHRLINAQFFGVPHRRKRVIGVVIFDTTDEGGREILFDSEGSECYTGTIEQEWEDATGDATESITSSSEQILDVIPFDSTQISSPYNKSNPKPGDVNFALQAYSHHPKIAFTLQPIFGQGSALEAKQTDISNTLTAIDAVDRGTKIVEFDKEYFVRKLTGIEMERLMGWPDEHTAHGSNGKTISMKQRRKMCGNGLVAPVAEWAGRRLDNYMKECCAEFNS